MPKQALKLAIEMRPLGSVRPSTYNPRTADERRLQLVELSLRKLGWLLPIFATPDDEILSGHQRHLVAERIGLTHVPVSVTKPFNEHKRKAVNIVFNRATNDLQKSDTCESLNDKLQAVSELIETAKALPDVASDHAPCMNTEWRPIGPLLEANRGRWIVGARNTARSLAALGITMPVVVDPAGVVVNGIGRLQAMAEDEHDTAPIVEISHEQAEFARAMLNYLSMDFNVHERYADVLRHNSFRRSMSVKSFLGVAFRFDLFGKNYPKSGLNEPRVADKWRRHYGLSVLDWGAGLRQDVERLRAIGVDSVPFEPYCLEPGTEEINPAIGRGIVSEFLEIIRSGRRFDSIFQNSVMNSVPFVQDRLHIITLISALCHAGTKVHACAASVYKEKLASVHGRTAFGAGEFNSISFAIDYEPNTILADYSKLPKVQKYHTPTEWAELWQTGFKTVRSSLITSDALVGCVCSTPHPVDAAKLAAAIRFEFDLPYPDGSRLGLVEQAMAAFSQRLGISLN